MLSVSSKKSLIDFMIDIANIVFSANGKQDDPYDINFTNNYVELHNFEENCGKKYLPINKITQDKKNKSITVDINETVDKTSMEKIVNYCGTNNIDIAINKDKISNITISKNTKGVLEERKWKKPAK
jgi:hypothetical protein